MGLKVTLLGWIQALKNIGLFLGTYAIADIQADPVRFFYAFLIYALTTTVSDLYLLNKAHEAGEAGQETEETE